MSDQPPQARAQKQAQANNPLHGLTLKHIVTRLVEFYGFPALAERVPVNCFRKDPSIKSSLTFLRKTPWARNQVEQLYLATFNPANPWANSSISENP